MCPIKLMGSREILECNKILIFKFPKVKFCFVAEIKLPFCLS